MICAVGKPIYIRCSLFQSLVLCVIRQSYALVVFLGCLTYKFSSGRLPPDGVKQEVREMRREKCFVLHLAALTSRVGCDRHISSLFNTVMCGKQYDSRML
jgi:hypothetical protein